LRREHGDPANLPWAILEQQQITDRAAGVLAVRDQYARGDRDLDPRPAFW
jgi:hypothetical protein